MEGVDGLPHGLLRTNVRERSWLFQCTSILCFLRRLRANQRPQLSIYKALGFDTQMQFNMNLIGSCINAAVAWYAVSLEDRMPRRKVLVIGTLLCSVLLAANAAFSAAWASEITSSTQNLNIGRAGAAFFFLFGVAYAFTVSVFRLVNFDKHRYSQSTVIRSILLFNHSTLPSA